MNRKTKKVFITIIVTIIVTSLVSVNFLFAKTATNNKSKYSFFSKWFKHKHKHNTNTPKPTSPVNTKTLSPTNTVKPTSSATIIPTSDVTEKPTVNPTSNPTSKPNDTTSMIHGVFVGNDPKDVTKYENWLGKKSEGVLAYTGVESWEDFDVGWACDLWKNTNSTILWSVPLIPKGASLAESAKGNYNEYYLKAAKSIANFRPNDSVIYVRTGWEFNGDWFPWAASGQQENYIGAWKQFVNSFRSVSSKFKFDWCPNVGDSSIAAEKCYPGDEYVDSIGMDIYDEYKWSKISDPAKRWESCLTRSHGLNWIESFAKQHDKRLTIPEWGVGGNESGDNPYFIEQMANWMKKNNVLYECYWDSNADYPGMLHENQYPKAGTKYKEVFGK